MSLSDIINALDNRSSFGTTLTLNDGQLRINENPSPERVVILGTCNNPTPNNRGTDFAIPTGVPIRPAFVSDTRLLNNGDPERTPSEILTQFEDAYNGGALSFEFVIVSRAVAQIGANIAPTDTIIPASTVYTGRVTDMGGVGAHPLGITNAMTFQHADAIILVGGERTYTPAIGAITVVAQTDMDDDDYIQFTHIDGTVHAFWFNVSGNTPNVAAAAAVNAGTIGSTLTEVDIQAATTASEVRDALAIAIASNEALTITPLSDSTDSIDLEADNADGNSWTISAVFDNVGNSAAGMTNGSATHSVSTRIMKFTREDGYSNVTTVAGIPIRLPAARRDAAVFRFDGTQVNIVGGMSTIKGGADTAHDTNYVIAFTSTAAKTAVVSAGTPMTVAVTDLGEAAYVEAGGVFYLIGGNEGGGVRSDVIATIDVASGVTTLVDNLPEAARWMGAYYSSLHGRIYIYGGETASGAVASTLVLDVPAGALDTTVNPGNMTEAKYDFGYAGINQAGWAFGGTNALGATRRVERFDPDTLTWQRREDLALASAGGAVNTYNYRLFYADAVQGHDFNIGLNNLAHSTIGFPDVFPFEIQVNWEVMSVTGVTVTRARGRDVDAFVVVRAQRGSEAVAHIDFSDITEGPEALYDQLEEAYERMIDSSRADYVLPPARAVADSPYLPVGKNYAYQLGKYCHAKTKHDRACMGVIGVHPIIQDPIGAPTELEIMDWANKLIAFDRLNYQGEEHWKIGDGITDTTGDRKPDTYGFWLTTDGTIPVGSPPMVAGNVARDEDDRPIDLGKYLFVVYSYGFSTNRLFRRKYPNAPEGYMRSAAAAFTGVVASLPPSDGSTNADAAGFVPYRLMPFRKENDLNRRRYIGVVDIGGGTTRWNTGRTWAWDVDRSNRSDYVLGSTFRKMATLTRLMRDVIKRRYFGKPPNGPHINALNADLSEVVTRCVEAGICGPNTDFQFEVEREDIIIGRGVLRVNAEFEGELTNVDMIFSNFVN